MLLHSSAFQDGFNIPYQYTCDGKDISPPLRWSNSPENARSFVLLVDDPDAPAGTWHHWAAYDIPAHQTSLAEGAAQHAKQLDFKQAINDFRQIGYGGPCPPHKHGPHHYRFRLFAVSVDRLPTGKSPTCVDVEREARKYIVADATLIGVYGR